MPSLPPETLGFGPLPNDVCNEQQQGKPEDGEQDEAQGESAAEIGEPQSGADEHAEHQDR